MPKKRDKTDMEEPDMPTEPRNRSPRKFNARKHGLLCEGVTELDDPDEFKTVCCELGSELGPVGKIEEFLVKRLALCMLRLKRACMLEAEFITACLHPPVKKTEVDFPIPDPFPVVTTVIDEGLPARMPAEGMEQLMRTFHRYETALENKMYRALHQLERRQRMRRGECLPAPLNMHVDVHGDKPIGSFGNQRDSGAGR